MFERTSKLTGKVGLGNKPVGKTSHHSGVLMRGRDQPHHQGAWVRTQPNLEKQVQKSRFTNSKSCKPELWAFRFTVLRASSIAATGVVVKQGITIGVNTQPADGCLLAWAELWRCSKFFPRFFLLAISSRGRNSHLENQMPLEGQCAGSSISHMPK